MRLQRRIPFGGAAALALLGLACLAPARAQEGQELGTWAFSYPDNTKPGAVLDLRSLNEKTAGETGFVHLSADGQSFVLGSGKPVRFWACGSDVYRNSPEDMARHARFLARIGVNMVRLHTQIAPDVDGGPITDVNEKEIDGIWRMVAALKKEGIYTTISPYWANGKKVTGWGIDGYTGQTDLWGLLFFDPNCRPATRPGSRRCTPARTRTRAFRSPKTRRSPSSRSRTRTACSSGPCRGCTRRVWPSWAASSPPG